MKPALSELLRGLVEGFGWNAVDATRRCMNKFFASLGEGHRYHVVRAFHIGLPLPLLVARPLAGVASDVENGIQILGHDTLERAHILDRPLDQADGIFL